MTPQQRAEQIHPHCHIGKGCFSCNSRIGEIAQAITDAVAAQKEKDALVADEQYPWADLPYGHSAHNKHTAGKQIAKAIRESK